MNSVNVQDVINDGILFGYPKCCIDEFVYKERDEEKVIRKLFGTGYVPCAVCHESKTEQELVDAINKNRNLPLPFPLSLRGSPYLSKSLIQSIYATLAERIKTDFEEDLIKLEETFNAKTAMDIAIADVLLYGEIFFGKD